jgi:hypothetical protein
MEKHFVTFCSPGTFFSETTTKDIDSWDVEQAQRMAQNIKERHNALPYGFYFTTRKRGENDLDSKETNKSPMYYLGGKVMTLADVKAENDPENEILISNMEINGYDKIIVNTNSWKFTAPLNKEDVVLL